MELGKNLSFSAPIILEHTILHILMIFLSTFLKIALLPYFTMFVRIPTTFKIFLIDGIMPN